MANDTKYPTLISFITPLVATSDRGAALDHRLLRDGGFEAVLSMEPVDLEGLAVHHLHLDIVDRVPLPFPMIAAAITFIEDHVRQGRRVLVHCEMGISRSPSLAVCYLHQSQGMTIDAAIAYVKSVRPTADPHPELIESIRAFYSKNGGRSGVEGTGCGAARGGSSVDPDGHK